MENNAETSERLDLIQMAVLVLRQDMPNYHFHQIVNYIEGLCRHRDLPVSTCQVPAILANEEGKVNVE